MLEFKKFECGSLNYILRRFEIQNFYSSGDLKAGAVWISDRLFSFLSRKPVSRYPLPLKSEQKLSYLLSILLLLGPNFIFLPSIVSKLWQFHPKVEKM